MFQNVPGSAFLSKSFIAHVRRHWFTNTDTVSEKDKLQQSKYVHISFKLRKRKDIMGSKQQRDCLIIQYSFIFLFSTLPLPPRKEQKMGVCMCMCHAVVNVCQFLVLTLRFILRYWAAGRYMNLRGGGVPFYSCVF